MTDLYDVAVVGAGPAGSALAIRLADAGRSVLLLDAGAFEAPRIGESLAPGVQPLLRELGGWQTFEATGPIESWGTKSRWTADEVDQHSHLFSQYGSGWHVDRRAFDEGLARLAAERGASLRLRTPIRSVEYERRWRLRAADARQFDAAVLVDATGRSGRIARMLGAHRMVFDHLVGVGCVWEDAGDEHRVVGVEAAPEGWWYSAPLPNGELITLLMTDADVCREGRLTDDTAWRSALDSAMLTSERVGDGRRASKVRSHAAFTARLLRSDDRPWLAVGDAALSVDPLSGSGVIRALRMARDAVGAVDALLGERYDHLEEYEHARNVDCDEHLYERLEYYDACRLYDSMFWTRRRAVARLELVRR